MTRPQSHYQARVAPGYLVRWGVFFALGGILVGLPWILWVQRRSPLSVILGVAPAHDMLLGATAGLLFAGIAWLLFLYVPPFQATFSRLYAVLGFEDLTIPSILLLAISAGVGEELLFRGVLQPHLGLWVTSLLFGLAHPLSSWYVGYAALAGLILGGIAEYTGALLAPIVCHAVIDGVLLILARRWARTHSRPPVVISS